MESTRQSKVSRLIQKDLSEIIRLETRNLFGGSMISVTVVRMSPDLGTAKVYLSVFPSNKAEDVLHEIKVNTKLLRGALGRKVGKQLRIVPNLVFYIDDSLDYIDHIDKLL